MKDLNPWLLGLEVWRHSAHHPGVPHLNAHGTSPIHLFGPQLVARVAQGIGVQIASKSKIRDHTVNHGKFEGFLVPCNRASDLVRFCLAFQSLEN